MIGLIVTGHANFGSGMTSSVNLIAGEQEAYRRFSSDIWNRRTDRRDCESNG